MKRVLSLFFFALSVIGFSQNCGADFFIANDNSGSVDALENVQGRQLITALADRVAPLGNANDQSRFAISTWAESWLQFNFPSAGTNYTTELNDVRFYETEPRTIEGETDLHNALLNTYRHIRDNPIAGRLVPQVIVLLTDTECTQINSNITNLASEIKEDGVYILLVAIEDATGCPILQGENVSSPGGYFSAANYQEIENEIENFIDDIIIGCDYAPPIPLFDLKVTDVNFYKENCTETSETLNVEFNVVNIGDASFNDELIVSFYENNPFTNYGNFLGNVSLGSQNITTNSEIPFILSEDILDDIQNLYLIVNFNGTDQSLPLEYDSLKDILVIENERNAINNYANSFLNYDDSCSPNSKITTNVYNYGLNCENQVVYQVEVCNNGSVDALITSIEGYSEEFFQLIYKDEIDINESYWNVNIGGNENDRLRDIIKVDDGFIVCGTSDSQVSCQKSEESSNKDLWVAKISETGELQWNQTFGGSEDEDYVGSMIQLNNGNIVISCSSDSPMSGDKSENTIGDLDLWIICINSSGNLVWENTIQGNDLEGFSTLTPTSDGGLLIAVESTSGIGFDKSEVSNLDPWIIKLSSEGVIEWENTIQTDLYESTRYLLFEHPVGEYNLILDSQSGIALDKTVNPGLWFLKLGTDGEIVSQSSSSFRASILEAEIDSENNVVFLGYTDDGGINGISYGGRDLWVLVTDFEGNYIRDFTLGGSENEAEAVYSHPIWGLEILENGDYIIGSDSKSGISGVKTEPSYGDYDYWILRTSPNGEITYQKSYGGIGVDSFSKILSISNSEWIVAGFSNSPVNQFKSEKCGDDFDYWILKQTINEGIILEPQQCETFTYIYDTSSASPGTYDFSFSLEAEKTSNDHTDPIILPDQDFTANGETGLYGFDGTQHTSDDVTIGGSSQPCSTDDDVSVEVEIVATSLCEEEYTQAKVTVINDIGTSLFNTDIHFNLSGAEFRSEPYDITNDFLPAYPNIYDSNYPNVDNALYGKAGNQSLAIYELTAGTSEFYVDLSVQSSPANLSVYIDGIPTVFNQSGQTNTAQDAEGVTVEALPEVTMSCPADEVPDNQPIEITATISGASNIFWASNTVGIFNDGTNTSISYDITDDDRENGYVDFTVSGQTANGCTTTDVCRVNLISSDIYANDITITVCDDENGQYTIDDFGIYEEELIDSQTNVTVTYHEQENQAENNTDALTSPWTTNVDVFYARVEDEDGEYDVGEITVIKKGIINLNSQIENICDPELPYTVNFGDWDQLVTNQSGLIISYYTSQQEAEQETDALPKDGYNIDETTYYIRVANDDCFAVTTLTFNFTDEPDINTAVSKVYCSNEQSLTVDLSQLDELIVNEQGWQVTYHTSLEDTEQDVSAINNYSLSGDATLYARIGNDDCYNLSTLSLTLQPYEKQTVTETNLCEGTTYTLLDSEEVSESGTYVRTDDENCIEYTYDLLFNTCINTEGVECRPDVPNVITPRNSAGANDLFKITGPIHCSFEVKDVIIYNRWGNELVNIPGVTNWASVNQQLSSFELQPSIYFYEFLYKSINQDTNEELEGTKIGAFTVLD